MRFLRADAPSRVNAFERQLARLAKLFEVAGDVDLLDRGKREARPLIVFRISAPGYGLPTDATFEYRELYERRGEESLPARCAMQWATELHSQQTRKGGDCRRESDRQG